MKVVLDASAAIPAALGHDPGPAILKLLDRASLVIVPDIFVAEVTSGLWKYVNAGRFSIDHAIIRLQRTLDFVQRRELTEDLAEEVLREASARRHAVYDMFYAVLARREGAAVITLDKRLRKLVEEIGLPVQP